MTSAYQAAMRLLFSLWVAEAPEFKPRFLTYFRFVFLSYILLFATIFSWLAGKRGLYLYDYSIVFDGAWRIVSGQVPYRDFAMSHAPLAYYMVAGAFQLGGVSFSSFLGIACLLNVVGTLLAYRIGELLFPRTGLLAAALTSVWFISMPGFPQIEQCAFFWNFLALWAILESRARSNAVQLILLWLSGASIFAAGITKQNAGVFFVPVLMVALLPIVFRANRFRFSPLLAFGGGVAVALGCFTVWLRVYSDTPLFIHHVLEIPSRFGGTRLLSAFRPAYVIYKFFLGINLPPAIQFLNFAGFLSLTLAVAARSRTFSLSRFSWSNFSPTTWSLPAMLLLIQIFHFLMVASMLNEAENGLPFVGIQLALIYGLFRESVTEIRISLNAESQSSVARLTPNQISLSIPFFVIFTLLFVGGARTSWDRTVNQFPRDTTFAEPVEFATARPLLWGSRTFLGADPKDGPVSREQFDQLLLELQRSGRNFFVFPSATILYGLLGKPSVAPWLFYLEGHSLAREDFPRLDQQAMTAMQRHNVCIWVRETTSWMGEFDQYKKFPKLSAWLEEGFERKSQIGPFELLERKGCAAGEPAGSVR